MQLVRWCVGGQWACAASIRVKTLGNRDTVALEVMHKDWNVHCMIHINENESKRERMKFFRRMEIQVSPTSDDLTG